MASFHIVHIVQIPDALDTLDDVDVATNVSGVGSNPTESPAKIGPMAPELSNLPGDDPVTQGLEDLNAGRRSVPGLVVAMAAPRLRRLGIEVPEGTGPIAAHQLYETLSAGNEPDPYRRFNALVARVVSFARALEHASAG